MVNPGKTNKFLKSFVIFRIDLNDSPPKRDNHLAKSISFLDKETGLKN